VIHTLFANVATIWSVGQVPDLLRICIVCLRVRIILEALSVSSVLIVWSADDDPGLMHAIITILDEAGFRKESRSTIVNFEALNGT